MAQSKSNASSKKANEKTSKKNQVPETPKAKSKKPVDSAPPPQVKPPIRREVMAVVCLFLAVFVVISHFSSEGKFIVFFANFLKGLIGWGFWVSVPAFLICAVILGFHQGKPVAFRTTCALMLPILVGAIGSLFAYDMPENHELTALVGQLFTDGQNMASGGVLGGLIGLGLESAFSIYGAILILFVLFFFCGFKCLNGSFRKLFKKAQDRPKRAAKYDPSMYDTPLGDEEDVVSPAALKTSGRKGAKIEVIEPQPERKGAKISRVDRSAQSGDIPLGSDEEDLLPISRKSPVTADYATPIVTEAETAKEPAFFKGGKEPKEKKNKKAQLKHKDEDSFADEPIEFQKPAGKKAKIIVQAPTDIPMDTGYGDYTDSLDISAMKEEPAHEHTPAEEEALAAGVDIDALRSTVEDILKPAETAQPPKASKKQTREEVAREAENIAAEIYQSGAPAGDEYVFPPVDLLRSGTSANSLDSKDEIRVNKQRLEDALHSFGINANIVGVTRGPTVTRYDIELERGVKLARVTNLAGDLALALGVINVRIAPIQDMISTVGIEVPNKIVSTVYLRDIIDSPKFLNAKSKLSFALGKDIGGECVVGNIAKLPHMLIAGTTGSGKSVCMNSLILSLLYKARPDEVKLIMIDPKMVELGVYNGIPHLFVPAVTDPKKAAGALQWSVVEMLKRYRAFSEIGVRDLESYNKHCQANDEPTFPQIVIVIDELADLMLVASKDVEESICRVAQMGRAAGMHLIIATQRPSADVITGLMKANIPSRIAFAVSSSLESRIILDQTGAEKLVGMGDMLFSPVGIGKPTRIQGAYVSDEEREDVIRFIKESNTTSEQNPEIEEFMDKAASEKGGNEQGSKGAKEEESSSAYDEMLPQAVDVVLETKSCSVSMLQRRIKLGYSRAARIVDQMEELGVVGPYEGAKPRKVLVDREAWMQIQAQMGLASDEDLALASRLSAQSDRAFIDPDEMI